MFYLTKGSDLSLSPLLVPLSLINFTCFIEQRVLKTTIPLSAELNTDGALFAFPNKSLMVWMTGLARPGHSVLSL